MKRRLISLVTSLAMICSLFTVTAIDTSAYSAHTQQEALEWVRSQVGKPIDYDGVAGEQCVDLILAYYAYLGVSSPGGNGTDYTWNQLPDGWVRLQGAAPQPGDILVYTGGYENRGHVAIYEADRITYHQNFNGPYVEKITYVYNELNNPYWGVIRPDFSTHTHSYTSAVTKQPTCTEKGVKTYTCSCGNSYTESIDAKGHSYKKEIVPPTSTDKGYTLYTCSTCGKSYKDNYVNPPELKDDGWYYCDALPSGVTEDNYTIEYNNYYEKTQTTSPGSEWTNAGVVKDEWVNKGSQYTSETDLQTSESRILVNSIYYHWCIPGAGINTEGNYEQSGNFQHYDSIPADWVTASNVGVDNGHPYYLLSWSNGARVYCKSGDTCDGEWGTHSERCKAWYKMNTYQDRERLITYKFTKNSGWTSTMDSKATTVTVRYKSKECTTHEFSEWTVTTPATCTTEGEQTRTCSVCNAIEISVIEKTAHTYTETIVEPTEEAQGYTLHTCSVCGDSFKDNYTDYIKVDTDAPQLIVDTKTASTGDEVTVSVLMDNNPGIITFNINLDYDTSVLTLVNAVSGDFGDETKFGPFDKTPFIVAWGDSTHGNNTTNGIVAELTFKVNENAPDGEYPITVSYGNKGIVNNDFEDVDFTTVNGAINIVSNIPGDLDSDGEVTMIDFALLQRYLCGWDVTIVEESADVDNDGEITMIDFALVQRYLCGWDVVLK